MKAVIITFYGEPSVLQLQERAQPEISVDEVLIRAKRRVALFRVLFATKLDEYNCANLPELDGLLQSGSFEYSTIHKLAVIFT